MIRVVLNTNIVVSAYLNEDGLPFLILKACIVQVCPLELLFRKSYPLDRRRARLLLKKIQAVSTIVNPPASAPLTSDPEDSASR
jgi:hypothetical protein